jgi:putative transposase
LRDVPELTTPSPSGLAVEEPTAGILGLIFVSNCGPVNGVTGPQFGSLKVERLHSEKFITMRTAKDADIHWILGHSQKRIHSTIGYQRPVEFEQAWQLQGLRSRSSRRILDARCSNQGLPADNARQAV